MSLGIFFSVIPSDQTMCPEVNAVSENEWISPGVKAAGAFG
jgi:hypothetical protein